MYLNRTAVVEIATVARRRPGARRALIWLGYAIGVLLVRGFLIVTRWIDDRVWPEIAAQDIEPPIFIFGNARSGTTLLHRLLSLDEDHFTTMKLYQSVFPRVCVIRTIGWMDRFDARIPGRPLRAFVDWINRKVFHTWEGIHDIGLDLPEEDEAIWTLSLTTPAAVLMFPELDALPASVRFDELPSEERRRFLDLYEDALRRFLFARGQGRRFLNKNVLFARRIEAIAERFPEARFVHLVRHPFEAIPSFLDMFHVKWQTHSPEIETDSPEIRALSRLAIDYYRCSVDASRKLAPARFMTIRYDELVADPKAAVLAIQRALGIEPGTDFLRRLDAAIESHREFTSGHSYSMAKFGLSEDAVYEELEDVFSEFGFAAPAAQGAGTRPLETASRG